MKRPHFARADPPWGAYVTRSVRTLWLPRLGPDWAGVVAADAVRLVTGTAWFAVMYFAEIGVILFTTMWWGIWSLVPGLLVGAAGVVGLAMSWRPLTRTSREMKEQLLAQGLAVTRGPPIQNASHYPRWLSRFGLTTEQVLAALDSPSKT